MIKAVLDSLDGIADSLKPEYKQGEDKKYYLDLDGVEAHTAVGPLVRAKQHEKTERAKTETELRNAKQEAAALQEKLDEHLRGNLPKTQVADLEKSWAEKLSKAELASKAQIEQRDRSLRRVLVDNEAQKLAAQLAVDADSIPVLLPHITQRLAVEIEGDVATTRVLGPDGKPSALTLAELGAEFKANKAFAHIIVGTKASGSGATGANGGTGSGQKVDFNGDPKSVAAALRARNPKLSATGS